MYVGEHVRLTLTSYDLPDDVFEPGEQRPSKAKKGKSANKSNGQAPAKKRSHTEAKLDVRSNIDSKKIHS